MVVVVVEREQEMLLLDAIERQVYILLVSVTVTAIQRDSISDGHLR